MASVVRVFGLAAAAAKVLADADVHIADAAALDDACGTDSTAEECTLSMRQLRGERVTAEVNKHEADAAKDSGFCCYKGAHKGKTCSTCLPTAIAAEFDYCATSDTCGGCGGTWCKSQCVYSGENPNDICGTAYKTAIAPETSSCSQSESECSGCGGTWCGVDDETAATESTVSDADSTNGTANGTANGTDEAAKVETVEEIDTAGFCCYAGTSKGNICGTCLPDSIAKVDTYCAASDKCGGCGGTWCTAQCVYSGSDPDDICGTAYADAIAPATEVCSHSEAKCTGCGGKWCASSKGNGNATVADVSPKVNTDVADDEDPDDEEEDDSMDDAFADARAAIDSGFASTTEAATAAAAATTEAVAAEAAAATTTAAAAKATAAA